MKTRGEQVFEEYLKSLGLKFTYEPSIGQRHPDFLVHAPSGDVLCEVKDFEQNDDDRAELDAVLAGDANLVTSREIPYGRIQLKFVRPAGSFVSSRAGIPASSCSSTPPRRFT